MAPPFGNPEDAWRCLVRMGFTPIRSRFLIRNLVPDRGPGPVRSPGPIRSPWDRGLATLGPNRPGALSSHLRRAGPFRNYQAYSCLPAGWDLEQLADFARGPLHPQPRRGFRLAMRVAPGRVPARVFCSAEPLSGFPPGNPSSSVSISRGWGWSAWRK